MDLLCFLSFVIGIAAMIWKVRLILGAQITDKRLIESWRDLFAAWDAADSAGKYLMVLLMLCFTFFRTGRWVVLAASIAAVAGFGTAVCGVEWFPIVKQIREMAKDFYDLIRDLRQPQPQNAN